MSRDWDLFASYNVGIIFLAIYILINFFDKGIYKQRIIVGIIGITLLHTFTWILINANADKSIEHFKKLQDGRFWSKRALTYSSEELAIYYANQKDYSQAIRQYKKYLAIDSLNSRIWGNLGSVYSKIGDRVSYTYAFEKAIECGSANDAIYADLANLYFARKQYDNALNVLRKGIKGNIRSACLYDMTGMALEKSNHDLFQVLLFYMQAIMIDSTYASSYFNAGRCFLKMNDTTNMLYYFGQYIKLQPDDPESEDIRQLINSLQRKESR
jgi:tetratricopeptide (TPR) repeat protein